MYIADINLQNAFLKFLSLARIERIVERIFFLYFVHDSDQLQFFQNFVYASSNGPVHLTLEKILYSFVSIFKKGLFTILKNFYLFQFRRVYE